MSTRRASSSFPVVGVGASAGGLEAFTKFLEKLPEDLGRAFVLVQKIYALLRSASGVDFAQYNQSTLHRRITLRMVLHQIRKIEEYVRFLLAYPREVEARFDDVLQMLPERTRIMDFLVEHAFPKLGPRKMLLNARLLDGRESERGMVLLAIRDVTEPGHLGNQS
jgi:hypothetical protein